MFESWKKVEQVIDEKKLYKWIKAQINPYGKPFEGTVFEFGNKVMDYINAMEKQPQADKWIPCEVEQPKEYGQYLYTDKYDEVHEGTYCPPLRGMVRGWSTCEVDGYKRLSDEEVIAWQSLPQPYKKEGA